MPRPRLAALAALATLAWPGLARAHQSSFTYGALTAAADRAQVDYHLKIRSSDLAEPLGLAPETDPDDAALRAGEARLYAYVAERISLSAPGQACTVTRQPLELVHQADRFARLGFRLTCPAPIATVELDYDLFFDLDAGHIGLVTVDGEAFQLRAPDDTRLVWQPGGAGSGLASFVTSGLHHILAGPDHLLFLLALLFGVLLVADGPGHALRPLPQALRRTAGIVTAFTAAHSLTLIAAALGWFDLPSRLVESVIAASIVFVAVDNVRRPAPSHRVLVTFGFGLIHGLGFAAMLTPLLPAEDVIAPLLCFNLGVELGQLALIAFALPALFALARVVGPERYRRQALVIAAIGIGSLGAIWFVERALGLTILGL